MQAYFAITLQSLLPTKSPEPSSISSPNVCIRIISVLAKAVLHAEILSAAQKLISTVLLVKSMQIVLYINRPQTVTLVKTRRDNCPQSEIQMPYRNSTAVTAENIAIRTATSHFQRSRKSHVMTTTRVDTLCASLRSSSQISHTVGTGRKG